VKEGKIGSDLALTGVKECIWDFGEKARKKETTRKIYTLVK
jgi:hypothetical protein